ncbi:MAG TPA: cellulase family glycosylhydrolase [Patescibacteria group bacterium]|nr:cellulase family glycosylhydrolase [Patescibacteria group bacterium]
MKIFCIILFIFLSFLFFISLILLVFFADAKLREYVIPLQEIVSPLAGNQHNSVFYGVNVEMSQILPSSSKYVVNSQKQDLIDIAHHLGINMFRVTNETRSFPNDSSGLYTKDEWNMVLDKMKKYNIKAIVLVEYNGNDNSLYLPTLTAKYVQFVKDYVINSGLGNNKNVYAIDLANEPILNANNIDIIRQAAKSIKSAFPKLFVTVGGWRTDTLTKDSNGNELYTWNDPSYGKLLGSFLDFYSVHIYDYDKQMLGIYPNPYQHTLNAINTIRSFSGNKPILIGEFGEGNGEAFTDQNTLGTPSLQANVYAGVFQAVSDLHSDNILGALAYQLYPRQSYNDGWSFIENNGNTIFPAGYVIQQYATGTADIPFHLPLSNTTQTYRMTLSSIGQLKTVAIRGIIGLQLGLSSGNMYTLQLDSRNYLEQTEPFRFDKDTNYWETVFHAMNQGETEVQVFKNFSSSCKANNCPHEDTPVFHAAILVE